MFSITKSDDPHILYQCLDFNMKNRATAQIKCELENYGVYTDCQNQGVCMRKSMKSAVLFASTPREKSYHCSKNYGIYRVVP